MCVVYYNWSGQRKKRVYREILVYVSRDELIQLLLLPLHHIRFSLGSYTWSFPPTHSPLTGSFLASVLATTLATATLTSRE